MASPHLFVLYTKMITRNLENKDGFRIGGRVINNVRYADDTVIHAETEHELQQLVDMWYRRVNRKVYSSTELNPTPRCSANHHPYLHVRLKFTVNCSR